MHQSRLPKRTLSNWAATYSHESCRSQAALGPWTRRLSSFARTSYQLFQSGDWSQTTRPLPNCCRSSAVARFISTSAEGIATLVALANIFHLLPSTANTFLEQLVNLIVKSPTWSQSLRFIPETCPKTAFTSQTSCTSTLQYLDAIHEALPTLGLIKRPSFDT